MHKPLFKNLDFESAQTTYQMQFAATSVSVPGWSVFSGTIPQPGIDLNIYALGSPHVFLAGSVPFAPENSPVIEGNFTMVLQTGDYTPISVSIAQTGLVPASAVSLQFKALLGADLEVRLGGQNLAFVPLVKGSKYTLYGADIPPSAVGNNEELDFIALAKLNNYNNNIILDSIVFSPEAVPEQPRTHYLWSVRFCLVGLLPLLN